MKPWQCPSCGHVNDPDERRSFCGECFLGRTQAIEDMVADKVGLPRRIIIPRRYRRSR